MSHLKCPIILASSSSEERRRTTLANAVETHGESFEQTLGVSNVS